MRITLVSIFVFCVATASVAQQSDPQAIIDQAIEVSGGARFAGSVISFNYSISEMNRQMYVYNMVMSSSYPPEMKPSRSWARLPVRARYLTSPADL